LETVKLFLEKGISVDSLTDHGWSSLHLAAENGHLHVVQFLLGKDAQIDTQDNRGCRPIDLGQTNIERSVHCGHFGQSTKF
jgi:ankyrin repeat protein